MSRDAELTQILVQELGRHLTALDSAAASRAPESLEAARRVVHALKGSAGLAGEHELSSAMQRVEQRIREADRTAIDDAVEMVREAVRRLSAGESAMAARWPEPPADLVPTPIDAADRGYYTAEITDRLAQIDEALGWEDPVVACVAVYRHVHTIKGAASAVGDQPMAWFCHGLEDVLRAGRDARSEATHALKTVTRYRAILGALLEDPEAALAALRGLPPRGRQSLRPSLRAGWDEEARVEGDTTIRVSGQFVDDLFDHVGAIAVARERVAARVARGASQAAALRKLRADVAEALLLMGPPRVSGAPAAAFRRIERATQALARLADELEAASDRLSQSDQVLKDSTGAAKKLLLAMRQTPIRGLFGRLSAAVHAEARRLGRVVSVRVVGADETIDRHLAESLVEPCMQLARNAVVHGIEPPDERAARGKPPEATITLSARRRGNRLAVSIADDGAGVDVAAVRARALETGLLTDVIAEAADDEMLLELLFLPGFSMRADSPDLLAGRGIGLDITLASIQKLGGTIRLSSRHQQGFLASVDVPVETGLAAVLWVTAGGFEHAVPVANVRRVRVNDGPDAERIPHLATCLEPRLHERARYVLELEVGSENDEQVRVGVDAVATTEEVLVRGLSPLLWRIGPYAGAIVRGDGSLRLALDVYALAPRARARGRVPESLISEPPSRAPGGFAPTSKS